MSRDGRTGLRRWAADLAMGARFAVSGGREGWARTVLTAVGVGLGVAVLLVAASVPHMSAAHDSRTDARQGKEAGKSDHSLLVLPTHGEYHGTDITGTLLQPDGAHPVRPPGVREVPAPGRMVVSPALKQLLATDDGALLRKRLPWRITGTVGDAGLRGPAELLYYAGADDLQTGEASRVLRWGQFGRTGLDQPLDPALVLLIVVVCVVLLLPVAAFVAAAVRFGGERRDRRLAALRLVGADARMTRRVAAGEAATGSLLGLLAGAAAFLPLRWSANSVTLFGMSWFPTDVRPDGWLVLLILLGVPAAAVAVSLLAMRGVAVEPLGVVRRSVPRRRRLWWRLVPTGAGLALLAPLVGGLDPDAPVPTYQIAVGIVLILLGVTALLPWLLEWTVRRMPTGRVTLQLAVRRLQLDSGTAARAVSGITIAVAGAVALQLLFSAVQDAESRATGQNPSRAQVAVMAEASDAGQAAALTDSLSSARGVTETWGFQRAWVGTGGKDGTSLQVAGCATLRELARIDTCRDHDVFVISGTPDAPGVRAGARLDLSGPRGSEAPHREPQWWTVPRDARRVSAKRGPSGGTVSGVLATPGAVDLSRTGHTSVNVYLRLDPEQPDAIEYARNAVARVDRAAYLFHLRARDVSHQFAVVRRFLYAGAAGVLLVIGASMVVSTLEQLRERRRLLSVLVAFGTRRRTLALSVLWQTAVPVVLGMILAGLTGVGLGSILVTMTGEPLHVDWAVPSVSAGLGAGLIALVTLLSMPALWRLMRPEGLRTE